MDQTFAERILAIAIATLGDTHVEDAAREDAGRVIQAVLLSACPSEADLADLLSALGKALHVDLAIRRVLVEIGRLKPPAVVERAGRGVERLLEQAYRVGDHEALAELVLVALEEPRWAPRIQQEWGKAATTWAVHHLPRRYPLLLLVSGWLHAFGEVPSWMRELAEAHPALVSSNVLSPTRRWQLHRVAPSVAGWKGLAGLRGTEPTIEPSLFGSALDVAVETLERAIGETTDEGARLRLRTWFLELTGEVP